ADEGHDLCPTCLGRDHLVEVLSENPCMNCSFMPRALRVARLAQLCPQDDADLAPLRSSKRCAAGLSSPRMPDLSVEEDVLSLAASASQFRDEEETPSGPSDGSMREVMYMALRQLQLELPLGELSASGSAFFRRGWPPTPFSVPPSEKYLRELHACWQEPRALSRLSTDGRVLVAMHKSVKAGLDRMPAVESVVASLIVSPDEALRPDVRCPRTQCRVTDDLLCKADNAGAGAGCLDNSMAHLVCPLCIPSGRWWCNCGSWV
ncbi:hypothetical protein GOODEAATRI_015427, partial [Goodea atripinnis]